MNYFISKLKFVLPKRLKFYLHKLYFDALMVFFERKFPNKKLYFYDLEMPDCSKIIDYKTKSLIRHKLYEKYEIEAIRKLKVWDNNFIDLGSSIGLCSYLVSSKLNRNFKHILVEPNKDLLEYSKLLISELNRNNNIFINKAISYGNDKKMFVPGKDILSGKIIDFDPSYKLEVVECTNLQSIVDKYQIDKFNLLIDIEGLSFLPIFYEENIIKKCEKLIIEEVFDDFYSFEKIENQLKKLGFKISFNQKSWGSSIIGAQKV